MPDAMNKSIDHKPQVLLSADRNRFATFVGLAPAVFVFSLVAVTSLSAPVQAQSTVVIGGSGKSSVEVNLDILEPSSGEVTQYGRVLKMPGMKGMMGDAPVILRMPGMKSGTNKSRSGSASTAGNRSVSKLSLRRPTKSGSNIAKKAPALPPARVRVSPATPPPPKVARVTAPPKKALPIVKPAAAPAVPTAPRTISKPVQMTKRAPVAAPTPPPAPKIAAPKQAPMKVAPVPVVPAAPKAAPRVAPAGKQIASLPRNVNVSTPGLAMRVQFSGNSTRISAAEKSRLNALADKMAGGNNRLQLKSFAGGSGETPSASRRRSLSRALAVRSYLIEKGFRSTRIDVRALGMAADQGPPDRVDVIILVR
jgi:outer membrane protein OmpA-like peptidoglycan-associated protein